MTDSLAHASRLDSIEEAISAVAAGRPILVVDDEDRENEGDLIIAAEFADDAAMGFFVRYTSGVICAPMTADRAEALRLPPMVADNEDPKGTAYTVSCDAVGVTTGISAAERGLTGRVLAAAEPDPAAISRPGHVFPLIAKAGGVRQRPGHTEAGVEFARLAGAQPVAMIGEVVHDDGSMMRFDAVRDFADANGLVMVSIEQLIAYLDERDAAAGRCRGAVGALGGDERRSGGGDAVAALDRGGAAADGARESAGPRIHDRRARPPRRVRGFPRSGPGRSGAAGAGAFGVPDRGRVRFPPVRLR
jgi:3,4-dihydroxy 2-butanone 4-phosphate synthase/GTP cyclohydrolase II